VLVNATGAWADQVAQQAGVRPIGLQPLRRTAVLLPAPAGYDITHWPMVIDVEEEFYFKPDAGQLSLAPANEDPVAPCDAGRGRAFAGRHRRTGRQRAGVVAHAACCRLQREGMTMTASTPEFLRTPDERFAALPGFPFAPHYAEHLQNFAGLRMHYLDEGPRDASHVFLCLHGQPTWSYLYRRMLPVFVESGARVVVPDLFGFGRSDKPVDDEWYTFSRHRESLQALVRSLDLRNVTLVCQDWGGILGLTLPLDDPPRYARLLVMNTVLATGRQSLGEGFVAWRAWVNANPDLRIGALMQRSCRHLSAAEAAAYDAPFPDQRFKAGARRFPNLVCDHPQADGAEVSRAAARWWRDEWQGQAFMAIGMQDTVIPPPAMHALQQLIRNCPPPLAVAEAGHFVQEWGSGIARAALAHYG
jgi:haloalkane dehalogenase